MTGASVLELNRLRKGGHRKCVACVHPELKLDFTLEGPHNLRSSIDFKKSMCSFNGMVHGGVLALVLDEAMTCALMAEGHFGATAKLDIRYIEPVRPGLTAFVHVTTELRFRELFKLSAELRQDGRQCCRATAQFMKQALETHS